MQNNLLIYYNFKYKFYLPQVFLFILDVRIILHEVASPMDAS